MKKKFKILIVTLFTVLCSGIYAQGSNDPEFKGKIVEMTPTQISVLDYLTGEVINTHLWNRPGAIINYKTGDEITFIIIRFTEKYPFDRILITEVRRGL